MIRVDPVSAVACLGFAGWAVATSFWSVDPSLTRGRSLVYVGLVAFAWVVASLDLPARRRVLAVALGLVIGSSLVIVAFDPAWGIDRNDDWQGMFTNRNSLAPACALAVLGAVSYGWEHTGVRRGAAAVGALVAAVAMLGSGSRTAGFALVVAVVATATVVWLADRRRRRASIAAPVALGGLAAVVLVAAVVALWDETTFAQRRRIWDLAWDRIVERPVHGWGWFAIWTDPEFTSGDFLLTRGSAHGSVVEVLLGAGAIGLVAYLVVVVWALRRSGAALVAAPDARTAWWFAVVVFLVAESLTESFVLWFSYNWVLLMAAALVPASRPRRRPAVRTDEPIATATG